MTLQIDATTYKIEIGGLEASSFRDLLTSKYASAKKIILVDENTHEYCLEYMITTFDELQDAEVMMLPAGEENKVMEVCSQVWEAWSEYAISRNDLVINLGGGVVSDMGGFMASIFKRGLDFIQIPTTLLAMVDASVGGKTGIDMGGFKNQLGVFSNPVAVFIDPIFLQTLPEIELRNGWAEMLKHGLIASPEHWNVVKHIDVNEDIIGEKIILDSVTIKNDIVLQDPFEKNIRKKLNFGHTVAHAMEGYLLSEDQTMPHGFAVAIGMLSEAYLSYHRGLLAEKDFLEIEQVIIRQFEIPVFPVEMAPVFFEIMQNDKKNAEGKVKIVLLGGIGKALIDQEMTLQDMELILKYLDDL